MGNAVDWYEANVAGVAPGYEALAAQAVHGWLVGYLPATPALVLDVGAGTGRDAAWLAGLGYQVVAVEPSAGMRAEGLRRHGLGAIRWVADALPGLGAVVREAQHFEMILLSAVWMHLPPAERGRALATLAGLLRPGGRIALTLRHGPAAAERFIYPVSPGEVELLASGLGLAVEIVREEGDQLGRGAVRWTQMLLRRAG
jgi:SAM-dependent methyltransferase